MDVIFPTLDWRVYVEIIWYVAYDDADLLAMLFREPKNGPWQLRYRFRHYTDNKVWESDDIKRTYDIKAPAEWTHPRDRLVETMDACIALAAVEIGTPLAQRRIVVKGDGEKAGELLMKQPFAHARSAGQWRPTDPQRVH